MLAEPNLICWGWFDEDRIRMLEEYAYPLIGPVSGVERGTLRYIFIRFDVKETTEVSMKRTPLCSIKYLRSHMFLSVKQKVLVL